MTSPSRKGKAIAGEKALAAQLENMTLGQRDIQAAVLLFDKAIKCEKTPELLIMRARLHKKMKK